MAVDLSRQEGRYLSRAQHRARHSAEQQLAQPGVAVGAEHQKVGAGLSDPGLDEVIDRVISLVRERVPGYASP